MSDSQHDLLIKITDKQRGAIFSALTVAVDSIRKKIASSPDDDYWLSELDVHLEAIASLSKSSRPVG